MKKSGVEEMKRDRRAKKRSLGGLPGNGLQVEILIPDAVGQSLWGLRMLNLAVPAILSLDEILGSCLGCLGYHFRGCIEPRLVHNTTLLYETLMILGSFP